MLHMDARDEILFFDQIPFFSLVLKQKQVLIKYVNTIQVNNKRLKLECFIPYIAHGLTAGAVRGRANPLDFLPTPNEGDDANPKEPNPDGAMCSLIGAQSHPSHQPNVPIMSGTQPKHCSRNKDIYSSYYKRSPIQSP